jgi:hypothetical protein
VENNGTVTWPFDLAADQLKQRLARPAPETPFGPGMNTYSSVTQWCSVLLLASAVPKATSCHKVWHTAHKCGTQLTSVAHSSPGLQFDMQSIASRSAIVRQQ